MLLLNSFLTAYDPSDLPGSSVDPLGFDRGYTLLADKILPGLTNVASRPRYFSVLCSAIALFDARGTSANDAPRARYEGRLEAIQRAERFWALACVLACKEDDTLDDGGIRGIRYVQRALARLEERNDRSTSADFRLLSRQVPYGVVGIYGSVADALGMIDRRTLSLGPDVGRRLGEAFIEESRMPEALRSAIANGGSVGVTALTAWGKTAHLNVSAGGEEARVLQEALVADPVRARMTALLAAHPPAENEHELARLERIANALASAQEDTDLREALRGVVEFERCFRLVLMVFQRLLSQCQRQEPFAIELAATEKDKALAGALLQMPAAFERFDRALLEGRTKEFCLGLDRLQDVRAFLHGAATAQDVPVLVERILDRHRAVQHSKRDGGRMKMPWLEVRNGKVVPTMSSAMQVARAPETPDDVLAHPYRTGAVDHFLSLGGGK